VKSQTNEPKSRNRKPRSPLRVLVVRHAIAEDAVEFARTGSPDAERPLTKDGRRKMRQASRGLIDLVPQVGVIASSPLTRAVETAEILAVRYAKANVEPEMIRLSALAPGKPGSLLLSWLDEQAREQPVMVVGHEPHLGQFVSWALTGLRDSFVEFKKGAAVLLEFEDEVRAGRAKLLWSVRPGHLRTIGGATKD
jgi:phosphohistidine phosphatase